MILAPEQWHCLNPIEITTPRVALRPLRPTDAPDLARIAGNDAVAPKLASVTSPWHETDVLQWIEQSRWRGRVGFKLGVCLPNGTLIGPLGLGGTPKSFAYFLAPSLWGRWLMTEALQRFLPWACLRFGLHQRTADHFADNPSSGRVLEKLGFVKTGSARLGSAARIGTALGYTYCLDCEHLPALPTHE